ncbi:MAG: cytochrome c-type biogenesis protein CcmH [Rhodoferax sp.]|nr:MAG: cytochrome c-type biogenesis protein CcmH [Rhodoferax sp.]
MKRAVFAFFLGMTVLSGQALAAEAVDLAQDPVIEQRLVVISEELRCLVCQNESLAGSRADLANDLRREIRTLIKDGKTDAEIMEFMVNRYGDFVRYRPPVKPITWALWFGPALLLLLAGWGLWRMVRRNRLNKEAPLVLTPEQQAQAQALLNSSTDSK